MNWLTKEEIEARSKTLKGAIQVSIEHHRQLANATMDELIDGFNCNKATLDAKGCGLCQYYECKCKSGCPLFEEGNRICCKEYRKAFSIIWPIWAPKDMFT